MSTQNFLEYVRAGHYDGTVFHRVIKGFMVQCGGFEPGMKQKTARAPITNEANNGLKNNKYTMRLTPRHYAYLKISEGCNHRCRFCIIPSMRGDLASHRIDQVLNEAIRLPQRRRPRTPRHFPGHGARTVPTSSIAQEPWAAGRSGVASSTSRGSSARVRPWVRLHYVYP